MLTKTFCHIPGLGDSTEHSLWKQGCEDWDCFLRSPDAYRMNGSTREFARMHLEKSQTALSNRHFQFFRDGLGQRDAWRALSEFQDSIVYLDIETDGTPNVDSITTVGLYDGENFTCLVQGEDLGNFPDIISQYSVIVTFFGLGFDIPVLQKKFPTVRFDQIHVDLCPTLKKLGYRGGLKKIERQVGIRRSKETDGLTGRDAIRLWRNYQRGHYGSLETLIQYNREDVVNLKRLADLAYRKCRANALLQAGIVEGQGRLFESVNSPL